MTTREDVTARHNRGKIHWFPWTRGAPEDGSLYGQVTACGLAVEDPDDWTEGGNPDPDCRSCLQYAAGHTGAMSD